MGRLQTHQSQFLVLPRMLRLASVVSGCALPDLSAIKGQLGVIPGGGGLGVVGR